jgi:hypothetical protein
LKPTGLASVPDVSAHLPMLLAGLAWLFDVEQPATAIERSSGQAIDSVGNRTLRFVPSGPDGQAMVIITVTSSDPDRPNASPRRFLKQGELSAFVDLLDGMGEDVISMRGGYPMAAGGVSLARPVHPSLRAALNRYQTGCPDHHGKRQCDCGRYARGRRDLAGVPDVHRQAMRRRSLIYRGTDIATIVEVNAHLAAVAAQRQTRRAD